MTIAINMHLERLTIQGFKSFATKNELIFPDPQGSKRGITAVVGPNGSGKSNIADAVRWALGEQSMKALRGKKSEDVIFSGSDKKGKLGMAEVSLFLNNEDRKAPVDYSEIVLTRRLFRSGESEYLVNNARSRLSDIQIMLAKASFGQKTYSVIGQGTVESFLNTSLSERKEFFDEATGVKQYQIKRDDSLNKLRQSHENLDQARLLLAEIEPRLRSLTKQVRRLERRSEIEEELKEVELAYYRKLWHEINSQFKRYNSEFLELEQSLKKKQEKLDGLTKEHQEAESADEARSDSSELEKRYGLLQSKRDEAVRALAAVEARIEAKLEASGKFDTSWLKKKKGELEMERSSAARSIEEASREEERAAGVLDRLDKEKRELEAKISGLQEEARRSKQAAESREAVDISERLMKSLDKLALCEAENDIDRMRTILREIRGELAELAELAASTSGTQAAEKLQSQLYSLIEKKESLAAEHSAASLEIRASRQRKAFMEDQLKKIAAEEKEVEKKLGEQDDEPDLKAVEEERAERSKALEAANRELSAVREELNAANKQEEGKRKKLYELQRSIQALQAEIARLASELSALKVESARYETRLEDLESEIRQNQADFRAIKEAGEISAVDSAQARERIFSLRRQLEQIGGIDPEVEKEYQEAKTRHDFLASQTADLTGAITSLERIIRELDGTIKEQFDREFKIIEKKFEEYFKVLFGGGSAKIIKVMEQEMEDEDSGAGEVLDDTESGQGTPEIRGAGKKPGAEESATGGADLKRIKFLQKHNATGLAGIEIQATPPGKKIRSISMLSGGERALTAIALICAIISANPSPFVVLDEVDAALDEANSERLAKILDDLSHKTQFIVITHNRATMRRANILYGVTMQDDGVSKLLSIKLEDAEREEEV